MSYVLITGASSGLGEEFARQYGERKKNLILVARSVDRLSALAKELSERHSIVVQTLPMDLSHTGSAEKVYEACRQAGWEVETLVNNAGFGILGDFLKQEPAKLEEMLVLNMVSLSQLMRLFLPAMVGKKSGGVINVASTAAFQPIPSFAAYAATKSFVLSLSEAVHNELAASGVRVLALCPGPTETRFFDRAVKESGANAHTTISMQKAGDVVRMAISSFEHGRRTAVPGALNKMSSFFAPRMPKSIVLKLSEKVMRAGTGI